jgi:hypothetical protein
MAVTMRSGTFRDVATPSLYKFTQVSEERIIPFSGVEECASKQSSKQAGE